MKTLRLKEVMFSPFLFKLLKQKIKQFTHLSKSLPPASGDHQSVYVLSIYEFICILLTYYQTGPKLGKEYIKDVYCHPAYLTYVQSTCWAG